MRPVSRRFLAAARSSHTMVARARYLTSFQSGVDPVGIELPIISGDVKLSSTAAIRSTLDLTVSWPWHSTQPLTPYGDEVYVERGIDYGDGTREWVGLGYFRVESVEQGDAPFGSLRISGKDRMAQVIDSRLEAPVQYLPGQHLQQAVTDLIGDVYPDAIVDADFDMTKPLFVSSHVSDDKRFDFLDEIVTAAGKVWYWDHRGHLVIRSIPEPDLPVWEAHAGPAGLLITSSREMSRAGVYNSVVAYGQTADTTPPCRAVVRNMDSDSPTYWGGPFGHVPRFFSSSFLQTDAQCADAAAGILAKAVGLPYAVDLEAIPNPALEPFDPISVMPGPAENRRTFVVDELTIPLNADKAMSASMRDQSNVSIEGS